MSSSNSLIKFLIDFTTANGYYTVPIVAGTGFFLNLISLIILLRLKDKYGLKFITIKVSLEMMSCLLGVGFQNIICFSNCSLYPLWFMVYRRFYYYTGECLYYSTGFIEICLMYDRYLVLKNTKNWFTTQANFKYISLVCVSLPFIFFSPDIFSYILVPVANQTYFYKYQATDYGKSQTYYYYSIVVNSVPNLITVICLLVLTQQVLVKYRSFMKKKRDFIHNRNRDKTSHNNESDEEIRLRKKEMNFVRMILTLNSIYVLMRIIDFLFNVDGLLNRLNGITFKIESVVYKNVNFILIYLVEGINFFILIYWNKTFRAGFKAIIPISLSVMLTSVASNSRN